MKIKVFGRNRKKVGMLERELKKDFTLSDKPGVVISYGGDGTFLLCERKFPRVPKLLVRSKSKCFKCSHYGLHSKSDIKKVLLNKKYKILEIAKVNTDKKIGALYKIYQDKGGKANYKTFQRKIKKLADNKFISVEKITGGAEGTTTIIKKAQTKKLTDF